MHYQNNIKQKGIQQSDFEQIGRLMFGKMTLSRVVSYWVTFSRCKQKMTSFRGEAGRLAGQNDITWGQANSISLYTLSGTCQNNNKQNVIDKKLSWWGRIYKTLYFS